MVKTRISSIVMSPLHDVHGPKVSNIRTRKNFASWPKTKKMNEVDVRTSQTHDDLLECKDVPF